MIADPGRQLSPPPGRDPRSPAPALPAPDQQQARPDGSPHPPPARTRTIGWIAAAIAVLFLILLLVGLVPRLLNRHRLAAAANAAVNTPPQVYVVHAAQPPGSELSLAANTQPFEDAVLYARTSGFLRKRYVDLGDHVKAGQLLAEIDAPDIDQQLRQAQADLQQAYKNVEVQKANLEFARVTVERYKAADTENAVAKEDLDQRISAYQTAQASVAATEANVKSNEANVGRLQELVSFGRITAPFDGTIVQRNVDIGSLITAGSPTNNTTGAPTSVSGGANGLFEVAQIDTLRVFVSVPQAYAPSVKPGLAARISARGKLTEPVTARVSRTSDALDPGTRTLLTEIDIPNESHNLLPGMFVYASMRIGLYGSRWRVPDTAVLFDSHGTRVLIVGPGNKLEFRNVTLGRDFGSAIDIQAGITGKDLLVKQPNVSMQEGQVVTPIESKEPPPG